MTIIFVSVAAIFFFFGLPLFGLKDSNVAF